MNKIVRIALIGSNQHNAVNSQALSRLRSANVVLEVDTTDAALSSSNEFDAAIVDSLATARQCVEAGHHVLLTSPTAITTADTDSLASLCEAKGVQLGFANLARNSPACRLIIDRLKNGSLGEPGLLRVHRWSSLALDLALPTEDREQAIVTSLFGDVDLALLLFDALPTEVFAMGRVDQAYRQIHLGFPGGGMALFDYAQALPHGRSYDSLSLIGSQGAAYADDHHNSHLMFTGGNPTAWISDAGDGLVSEFQEFVACLAKGERTNPDGEWLSQVRQVTNAIEAAVREPRVIHQQGGRYESA